MKNKLFFLTLIFAGLMGFEQSVQAYAVDNEGELHHTHLGAAFSSLANDVVDAPYDVVDAPYYDGPYYRGRYYRHHPYDRYY